MTKFNIPPVHSNQIERPHLNQLVSQGSERQLILLSAPAGYGKTTLVSTWLNKTNIPNAWISLDDSDNDPNRFLQYLYTALIPIAPRIAENLPDLPNAIQPVQYEKVIHLLTNELALIPGRFILVLDDFHSIHSEAVLKIVSHLLDHIPKPMLLVILTRSDPPLPISRLRARNQLLEIRSDRLRFSKTEIGEFINKTLGLSLSIQDIDALETRTEGWAASLQMAALSMQGNKDIHNFICNFTGSHHYVMDYLMEEVLRIQPNKVRNFLLRTSILDRLCGPLCEAVVNSDPNESIDGREILESLEIKNLFLIPLDQERRWYRYHHLFADVLRQRLERQYPNLLPELFRLSSEWYEQNGFIAKSIEQAIAAGDHERAAGLIEKNGCFLLISGEVATLLNWTRTIEFNSESHPWLSIQMAWALALSGNIDKIEPAMEVPEKLLAPLEPTVEVRTMRGTIAAARAFRANFQGNTELAAEYAQHALLQLPDCSAISQSIRSVTTAILGDASRINGHLEEAIQANVEAKKIGKEANNLQMEIIANTNIGEILMEQGQLHLAADTFSQALHSAVRPDGQRSPLAGRILTGMSRLSYEWNQLTEAEERIRECLDLGQIWGDFDLQITAYAFLSRLELVRNKPGKSQEALLNVEKLSRENASSNKRKNQVVTDLAFAWLAQGDLNKISDLILKNHLETDDQVTYQRLPEYILLLRKLLAQNNYEDASRFSKRMLEQFKGEASSRLVLEVLILHSLALYGLKDTEGALTALEKALELAKAEDYVRLFLDEGERMTRLLCQVRSRQAGNSCAATLLSKIGSTPGMTQPSMQLLIEPLTMREMEVLKLIEAGRSNQEIAGQFVISIPTVKRHISNIFAKLGVKSRTQAVAYGKELKLFD